MSYEYSGQFPVLIGSATLASILEEMELLDYLEVV